MRTLHETLHPLSRPHYYRSCRCRLLHAGRQHTQSCVDENEPWSAIGLHVGMVAACPSQEELQFCLAAAQQPRPSCSSAAKSSRDFAEGTPAPWIAKRAAGGTGSETAHRRLIFLVSLQVAMECAAPVKLHAPAVKSAHGRHDGLGGFA